MLITLANVGQQLAQFSILYLAVVALQGGFGGPVSLLEAFAAFAFGRLATFIPVPPGGLGTTDAIITAMLTSFGLANNDALAATMVWRAATYFPQVIIGAITMLLWKRQMGKKTA
ncbi:MAG: flippase-like domain-containing protein [Proteobacteria bacterium]|nr:flippase-like domain-containing protein [Pseudomonadota bacterium]